MWTHANLYMGNTYPHVFSSSPSVTRSKIRFPGMIGSKVHQRQSKFTAWLSPWTWKAISSSDHSSRSGGKHCDCTSEEPYEEHRGTTAWTEESSGEVHCTRAYRDVGPRDRKHDSMRQWQPMWLWWGWHKDNTVWLHMYNITLFVFKVIFEYILQTLDQY